MTFDILRFSHWEDPLLTYYKGARGQPMPHLIFLLGAWTKKLTVLSLSAMSSSYMLSSRCGTCEGWSNHWARGQKAFRCCGTPWGPHKKSTDDRGYFNLLCWVLDKSLNNRNELLTRRPCSLQDFMPLFGCCLPTPLNLMHVLSQCDLNYGCLVTLQWLWFTSLT